MKRRATALVLLATMSGVACHHKSGSGPAGAAFIPARVGSVAPVYRARSLTGDSVRLGPGEPVTVVNVWATWCASCREEMEALDTLWREYGARGVRVVAVSVDQSEDARVRRYVDDQQLAFTVVHDADGTIEQAFGVVAVPTTFLLDSSGTVRWAHTGNISGMVGRVRVAIDSLVGPQGR